MSVLSHFSEFRRNYVESASPDLLAIVRSLILAFVVCSVLYLVKKLHWRYTYSGLPGPKFHFLEVWGNIRLVPFSAKRRNGHSLRTVVTPICEGLARMYPEKIFCGWLGFKLFALVNSPEAVQALMTDSSLIEKSFFYKFVWPVIGTGLTASPAKKWKPRRRMLNPSYNTNVLMDFIPIFNEHGINLVKKMQSFPEGKTVELYDAICLCVLDIVAETILGTKIEAQAGMNKEYYDSLRNLFQIAMERIIKFYQWPEIAFRLSENGKIFFKDIKYVHDFTRDILKHKLKEYIENGPNTDPNTRPLMDILLEFYMEKKSITYEGIIEEVDTFMAAANESTSASMLFTLHLIGLNPHIQELCHQELDDIFGDDRERSVTKEDLSHLTYIECCIKESLRLYPTVPIFGRELLKDQILCGYKLPKGTTIGCIPYILHRDPKLFPDPERYDPSRFFTENCVGRSQFAYIPFSAGSRNCIGQKFAMIEMKIVLSHILRNFRVVCLTPRDQALVSVELSLKTDAKIKFQLFPRT